jgi:transcription termination factor Rho
LIVLDSELAARGVYPAVDFTASRIAGEEHLREGEELAAVRKLRTELASLTPELASAEVRRLVEGSPDTAAALGTIRA